MADDQRVKSIIASHYEKNDPLGWFESERAALLSAVRQSAASGMPEATWDLALSCAGFFEVRASQMPEPVWLRRFFEATGVGFLLDLPHVWLEAHYRGVAPEAWLAEFPLDRVVEIHVAGVEADRDLEGQWIAPTEPDDAMLDFMAHAVVRCPGAKAVTFDAFSPSLTADVLLSSVSRIRAAL